VVLVDAGGRCLEVNPAAERILGLDRATLLAAGWPGPWSNLAGAPMHRKTLGQGREDGSTLWLEVSAQPLPGGGALVSFEDITRRVEASSRNSDELRHQADEALHKSEERFRMAMEVTTDGLWDWDIASGAVYFSPACTRMLGYPSDEFPTRMASWTDRICPEDRARVIASKQQCIEGAIPGFELEYRIETRDGRLIWILGRGQAVSRDEQGRALRMIGNHVNITRRKEAELEILHLAEDLELRVQERTAQLEAANREMEAFSYSVSHDLRSPLRGIDGFSQILLEDYQTRLDEGGRHCLSRIQHGTRRMGQLIDDLLKLSRTNRAELNVADLDLSSLCGKVVDELTQADPGRGGQVTVQPGLTVRADMALMAVVLENLLGNAWKFTARSAAPRIEVGESITAGGARAIFIRDNGAGFDMAYVGKLFNPFQRLHATTDFEGTGIGLAIVQRIIQRHGGQVWAQGEPGQGAAFFFSLP
jgi:PAS domain S-box-containing protein